MSDIKENFIREVDNAVTDIELLEQDGFIQPEEAYESYIPDSLFPTDNDWET